MEMVRRISQEIGHRTNNLTKAVVVFVLAAALVTTLLSSAVTSSRDRPVRPVRPVAWRYGALGEACSAVCSSVGKGCEDGDWGVHGEQSMRVALEAAGQSVDAVCSDSSGGFRSGIWDGSPYVLEPNGWCYHRESSASYHRVSSERTSCSATYTSGRRLCRCV
jgi:hypothetical protein